MKILQAFRLLRCLSLTLLTTTFLFFSAYGQEELKTGDVVFDLEKMDRASLKLPSGIEWCNEGENGEACLKVTASPSQPQGVLLSIPVDVSKWRGVQLYLTCRLKTENVKVGDPAEKWIGSKFQLYWKSETTGAHYADVESMRDTTEWGSQRRVAMVDRDAESGKINIGIQKAVGTVWFSQVKIVVLHGAIKSRVPSPNFKASTTTLRGVMSPTKFNEQDFADLEKWNANLIRWQLVRNWGKQNTDLDLEEYDKWFNGKLDELEQVLNSAQKHGIGVVIDIHSPPGGRTDGKALRIFTEKKYRDHFIKNWERIVSRYGGHPAIWGYDIINEPVHYGPTAEVPEGYMGVQVAVAKAIRAIDSKTPVIIESDEWDSPSSYQWMETVDIPNVIYQVHMYWPGTFTHQGVHNNWGEKSDKWMKPYPGTEGGKPLDKEALRRALQPVLDFQKANNVRIYVGEFSAARWAPGAAQYLEDCISLFEEYGWNWTYHAFRESNIWSLEHVNTPRENPTLSKEPTDREIVLKKAFSKNKRYPEASSAK